MLCNVALVQLRLRAWRKRQRDVVPISSCSKAERALQRNGMACIHCTCKFVRSRKGFWWQMLCDTNGTDAGVLMALHSVLYLHRMLAKVAACYIVTSIALVYMGPQTVLQRRWGLDVCATWTWRRL